MLLALLLLHQNRPFKVQIVLFFKDFKECRVGATIDANLLELVPEVVLDRLLLECVASHDDVILALEHEAVQDEILLVQQLCLLKELDRLLSIHIVIAFLDIHRDEVKFGLTALLPLLYERLVLFHDVIVVEHGEAEPMREHLRLEILEHHVRKLELLVGRAVLRVRQLAVKRHDWPECLAFGDQAELARSEVVVLAVTVHFMLVNSLQGFLHQIFNRELHQQAPDSLAIVKDARVFLLFLGSVEVAPKKADNDVFKEPLEHAPEDKVVLVLEVLRVSVVRLVTQPRDFVQVEFIKQRDAREHFKPVEFYKLQDLLVEDLFIFAVDEVFWEHVCDPLCQKVRDIAVVRGALVIKELVHLCPVCAAEFRAGDQLLLLRLPISWHWTVFCKVIVVVELLLLLDDMVENLVDFLHDRLADTVEAEDVFGYPVDDLSLWDLAVKYVLLKECVLPIHVRAVEEAVAVDDVVPERLVDVLSVVVLLMLNVVFVRLDVFARELDGRGILRVTLLVSAAGFILALLVLGATIALVEGLLQPAELVVEVNEDVGARDLDETIVTRLEEDYVLFVNVAEDSVSENLVDLLPVPRDHALLVQVDEVALDHLGSWPAHHGRGNVLVLGVDHLESVAEGLQLLHFLLSQKLLDDVVQQVLVAVLVLKLMG